MIDMRIPTPPAPSTETHAPVRQTRQPLPWTGPYEVKPWSYGVTVGIPVLDTPDELELVVELLRMQTVRPFIVIVDTGSSDENLARILALRASDVEVHSLRFNGLKHPSDFPAIAMELIQHRTQTEWLFCTHADCFLKRRDVIEEFIGIARRENTPAVGYQISPRRHEGWEGMISHTATLLRMPDILRMGVGWNQWRVCLLHGIEDHSPDPDRANWPDTEVLLNYVLRQHGVTPYLVDRDAPVEMNFERNEDHRIDHCRTLTAGKLYSPGHYAKASIWADDARAKARARLAQWKEDDGLS
jgi:glycosyltransferase involved in cell wall biosynthesis